MNLFENIGLEIGIPEMRKKSNKSTYLINIDDTFRKELVRTRKKVYRFYEKRLNKKITPNLDKSITKASFDMFNFHLGEMSHNKNFSFVDADSFFVYVKSNGNDLYIDSKLHYADPLNQKKDLTESIKDTIITDYEIAVRYAVLGELI